MTFLTWSDEYCVGVASIDEQHRELAELVNEIHYKLFGRVSDDDLQLSFRRLAGATAAHFRHEEDLIAQTDYPRGSEHARKHASLVWMLERFQLELDRHGTPPYLADRLEFLRNWLLDHIKEEDVPLAEHLKARAA